MEKAFVGAKSAWRRHKTSSAGRNLHLFAFPASPLASSLFFTSGLAVRSTRRSNEIKRSRALSDGAVNRVEDDRRPSVLTLISNIAGLNHISGSSTDVTVPAHRHEQPASAASRSPPGPSSGAGSQLPIRTTPHGALSPTFRSWHAHWASVRGCGLSPRCRSSTSFLVLLASGTLVQRLQP